MSSWGLVASMPACRALDELQFHVADARAASFSAPSSLIRPLRAWSSVAFWAGDFAARVETALVIYRLDSVKRLVRLVEVFNIGGLVGRQVNPHW